MPPRTRSAKSTKSMKENNGISCRTGTKSTNKITRAPRKVLGDKTNSASDDNTSLEFPNKTTKKPADLKSNQTQHFTTDAARPRRDRRVPQRFVDNQLLKNLSNSKENVIPTSNCEVKNVSSKERKKDATSIGSVTKPSIKDASNSISPLKSPKPNELSLVANRPRRISRLPSKFDNSSSKFTPVKPSHASTPLTQKNTKVQNNNRKSKEDGKGTPKLKQPKSIPAKKVVVKKTNENSSDTNNNAKRTLRTRKAANTESLSNASKPQTKQSTKNAKSPTKQSSSKTKQSPAKPSNTVENSYLNDVSKDPITVQAANSPVKPSSFLKKTITKAQKKEFSFKVLDENKKKKANEDIYNFTFDPDEEPPPQKKKRKAVKRKPAKKVVFKQNYDQNVNKALAALKNVVGKKSTPIVSNDVANTQQSKLVETKEKTQAHEPQINGKLNVVENNNVPRVQRNVASKIIIGNTKQSSTCNVQNRPHIQEDILCTPNAVTQTKSNYSIRPEDIAADFSAESSPQHDIDYSPVNTPSRSKTPETQISQISNVHHFDDPLNLRENISFDVNPIASSSMISSVRHPHASPWRIEFENLPIRWHVGSYVKPNMTPAVECSFVNFDDKNKKKHVYTNLVPENNDALPEITQKDQPNLVQTSIISFIKEMVEKSSSKKNRHRSATPASPSVFADVPTKTSNKEEDKVKKTTRQLFTPQKNSDKTKSDTSNADSSKDISNDKESSKDSSRGQKRKNNDEVFGSPAKTPRKKKDDKFFGFDDSENMENVSPQKIFKCKKSLRQAHARAVLREVNEQAGPTRAAIPVSVKYAKRAEVERLYDEMKSASDAPEIPAKDIISAATENFVEPIEELNEDSQTSVHLFEDIDVVHHLKPSRKSYGKAKKVTFMRQASSDTQDSDLRPENNDSDEEEDLNDLTFDPGMPAIEEEKKRSKKKQTKRQKMTKKEKEEAEAWAASFNSMCEDVEDFPLVVE